MLIAVTADGPARLPTELMALQGWLQGWPM